MVTWVIRSVALLFAIAILVVFFDILPRRSIITMTFIVIAGLAFIWFPDEASDYLGFSSNSFSGGPGPNLLAISGWVILIIAAAIAVFITMQTK